jgi:two-component system phosphate regulon sensor histidine kinase PhoR
MFFTPVRDNQKKIVGCALIFHDITHLKEIDKMKNDFVSVASHQLRTPLTAIRLFIDMLVRGQVGALNKEQAEYLDNVLQSTDRMVGLVNDLLNVTRIESGRLRVSPQPTNIINFLEGIISESQPVAASRKQKIVFAKDNFKLPLVPIDHNLLRQVIHNLITNAIRYSPEGTGVISVKVENKNSQTFTISVKDNGIGIPEEKKYRMFEKFFRADNAVKISTEGTGLGLYVSKMIVESSGGRIWYESEMNKGTTFFVEMPTSGMIVKETERGLAIS